MSDTPVGKEDFPNIHSKLPLAQLETFFSCPLTYYLRGETDPCLTTTFFQVVETQAPLKKSHCTVQQLIFQWVLAHELLSFGSLFAIRYSFDCTFAHSSSCYIFLAFSLLQLSSQGSVVWFGADLAKKSTMKNFMQELPKVSRSYEFGRLPALSQGLPSSHSKNFQTIDLTLNKM